MTATSESPMPAEQLITIDRPQPMRYLYIYLLTTELPEQHLEEPECQAVAAARRGILQPELAGRLLAVGQRVEVRAGPLEQVVRLGAYGRFAELLEYHRQLRRHVDLLDAVVRLQERHCRGARLLLLAVCLSVYHGRPGSIRGQPRFRAFALFSNICRPRPRCRCLRRIIVYTDTRDERSPRACVCPFTRVS